MILINLLLLRKGVYSYEYMDDWEKFNETALPEKEEFYSNLNLEYITDADYMHGKRVCKDFGIKNLGEYHDLYLKSDTLLLADVFENFGKMCLKIYQLDPAKKEFYSEPIYDEKYLKAKIKSYNGKINTNFHNNKIPKEGSPFICLSVILIDSVFKTDKNYYPQVFLGECKYVIKKRFLSILLTI